MIVKDEAPVIRRCLDSVRPLIDHWVIVDTGSTDGTQDIIREHLKDLPGELHERPWRDFAHNRSEALALARPHADYSLIIDADDVLEIPKGYKLPRLNGRRLLHRHRPPANPLPAHADCEQRPPLALPGRTARVPDLRGFGSRRQAAARQPDAFRWRKAARSSDVRERCRGARAGAGHGDRPVPQVTLHVLPGAELSRQRSTRRRLSASTWPARRWATGRTKYS